MRSDPPPSEVINSDSLHWDSQGHPLSTRFNDFYFSRVSGLDETQYVFLQHNQLPQRWQALQPGQIFAIGETGFGTGRNFLCSWLAWRKHAPAEARLHFISAERYPLSLAELRQTLSGWPQLAELAEQLLAAYPPACSGSHRLVFDQGRVQLTLLFNDACQAFLQFNHPVDAWFLDGFSPAKNPAMWNPELLQAVAQCSHPQTSFSTFTAASSVRRGLEAAGFEVKTAPGFSKKREMLYGQYRAPPPSRTTRPWYDRPLHPAPRSRSISIIGAGLAGASAAFALAERGCQVELFERGSHPGCGASGNPQGVLYAKLPALPTISSRIHLAGYLYSLALLQRRPLAREHADCCGLIQLALDPRESARQQKLLDAGQYPNELLQPVNAEQASAMAGYPLSAGGLYFPEGGWVSPAALCRSLLSHPNIRCHYNQPIAAIHFQPALERWQLRAPSGELINRSATLIVATAHEAGTFSALSQLPLKPIRGQTSSVSTQTATLKRVLCGNGYIAPATGQQYCFGASFDLNDPDSRVRASDHRQNLQLVQQMCPALAQQLAPELERAQGRVGFRCAAPDYLPVVGAVADPEAFIRDYAALRKDAKAQISSPPVHLPGLFVTLGHGSKGLITAPLSGALLADIILNEPPSIEQNLLDALNPARFIIKKLIKKAI